MTFAFTSGALALPPVRLIGLIGVSSTESNSIMVGRTPQPAATTNDAQSRR